MKPNLPAELLASPPVTRTVARILLKAGVSTQDLEDRVADVQVRVLRSLRNKPALLWPTTPEAWKGLAIRSTRSHLIDGWRKAKRRRDLGDTGVVAEDADDHGPEEAEPGARDRIDQQRGVALVDKILAESKQRDLDEKILEGLLDDKDQAQIAAELGLTHRQIRDRVASIRATFRAKVATTFTGGVLVYFCVALWPGPQPAHPAPPEPDPVTQAAELRASARVPCRDAAWPRCIDLLDRAARLDPAGDRAPEIRAVRERYEQSRDQ